MVCLKSIPLLYDAFAHFHDVFRTNLFDVHFLFELQQKNNQMIHTFVFDSFS